MSELPRLNNVLLATKAAPLPSQDEACSTADLLLHQGAGQRRAAATGSPAKADCLAAAAQRRPLLAALRLGGAVLAMLCVFTFSALLALAGMIGR